MSSNAFGSILRIFGIFMSVILFWFVVVNSIYFLSIFIFDLSFSWGIAFSLFGMFVLIRSFYPKNIFDS